MCVRGGLKGDGLLAARAGAPCQPAEVVDALGDAELARSASREARRRGTPRPRALTSAATLLPHRQEASEVRAAMAFARSLEELKIIPNMQCCSDGYEEQLRALLKKHAGFVNAAANEWMDM